MSKIITVNKLKKLGFTQTQGEFMTKGKFEICLDCYPYLIESGQNKSICTNNWNQFMEFYNKYNT